MLSLRKKMLLILILAISMMGCRFFTDPAWFGTRDTYEENLEYELENAAPSLSTKV